ncbi:MAG: M81 family metallopeptidase [Thermomicrobiales bacterium]
MPDGTDCCRRFFTRTNTFAVKPTDYTEFEAEVVRSGEQIREYKGTKTGVSGFVDAIEADPILDPVYLMTSNAVPGGIVTSDAVTRLTRPILEGIEREKPDAVVLVLHGAMVTEKFRRRRRHVVVAGSSDYRAGCSVLRPSIRTPMSPR